MHYQVKLDVFEGPFDLLLSLITKQKIDVCDVSLTAIVQDYLNYLGAKEQVDLEVTSEFLVLAATLLKIKSNFLIGPDQTGEMEDLTPAEAKELLIARLLEYKKFKNASEHFSTLIKSQYGFYRRAEEPYAPIYNPTELLDGTTIEELRSIFASLLLKEEEEDLFVSTQHILIPPVNLGAKIDFVLGRLQVKDQETFRNLTKKCSSRIEVAVTFLALLELYRRRKITIEQRQTFGEITVKLIDQEEGLRVASSHSHRVMQNTNHR